MEQALEADGEEVPAGSGTIPREPLPPPRTAGEGAGAGAGTLATQEAEAVAPVTIDPPLPGV
jgi:hypothetical protein